MRLLNTKTLELTNFVGDPPEYVILSHRWEEEEILFEDVSKIPLSSPDNPARLKLGFAKVIGTCALAVNDGYEWVWIDSCCIDKSSSAELQESINSMFQWYRKAQVCYVYLSDVADEAAGWSKAFEESQWFTRGWTLQELLAPCNVEFYSADWSPIGTKLCRTELVASITGIETRALEFDWGTTEDNFCAAEKLSWAAHRRVSKVEDSAYCLFGLFDVNMPLLYGEGEEKAFRRLQQAIIKETADHTLFLFAWAPSRNSVPMLARWITQFCRRSSCLVCRSHEELFPSHIPYSDFIESPELFQLSSEDAHYIHVVRYGVMVKLPLTDVVSREEFEMDCIVALLPLSIRGHEGCYLGIALRKLSLDGYIRLHTKPSLKNLKNLPTWSVDQNRQGAYTVYHENLREKYLSVIYPGIVTASAIKIAHFEFSSQSFEPLEWRCKTQHEALVQTDVSASVPLPAQQNDYFFLTVSFRNVVEQDIIGAITLWYSMSKIGLHNIVFFRDQRCLYQSEMEHQSQSQPCVRMDVPTGITGDGLRIIIRRISIPEHMWSRVVGAELLAFLNRGLDNPMTMKMPYRVQAGYRLEVTHFPKGP